MYQSSDKESQQVTIYHQDSVCNFPVSHVRFEVIDNVLNLEIETGENRACVLGFLPSPTLYIEDAPVLAKSAGEIFDEQLTLPLGWEDEAVNEKTKEIFRIYIGQHEPLDNNSLKIRCVNESLLEILWFADAVDFNYYDERATRNRLEVRCLFEEKQSGHDI